MPLYDYKCDLCGYEEEKLHSSSSFHQFPCPQCLINCPSGVRYEGDKPVKVYNGARCVALVKQIGGKFTVKQTGYHYSDPRFNRGLSK